MQPEQIKTLNRSYETKFKEKGSLFIGQAYPINSHEEINVILEKVKKQYYDATHHCYAYKLNSGEFKYSDNGEPNGTAGIRIINAIEHYELTNIAVVIIRYFGGVKLGVGPLGKAYYNSAEITLRDAEIITKKPYKKIEITSGFQNLSHIHRLISNYNAVIDNTTYDDKPHFTCLMETTNIVQFQKSLSDTLKGEVFIEITPDIIYL